MKLTESESVAESRPAVAPPADRNSTPDRDATFLAAYEEAAALRGLPWDGAR